MTSLPGNLRSLNELARSARADYIIHTGDFGFYDGVDAWRVGLTAGYQITDGLKSLVTVQYQDVDDGSFTRFDGTTKNVGGDEVSGFIRLQRDF